MIEISHEMIRYQIHFKEILCCDCFFDEIYFLLREKVNYESFEERFSNVEDCYFDLIYGSAMVICHDLLIFISQKNNLTRKHCISEVVDTKPVTTTLCSICVVDVFRRNGMLHVFKLRWS